MDSGQRNGHKRHSGLQERHRASVERRTSKKTSSKDRHGHFYPDDFRERTIRAVTPDSPAGANTDDAMSESGFVPSSIATSPSSTTRGSPYERSQEQLPSSSSNGSGLGASSYKDVNARPRTRTLEETIREKVPSPFMSRPRQRIGSVRSTESPAYRGIEDSATSIGFPSVLPSPPLPAENRNQSRQRILGSPPRTMSPFSNPPQHEDWLPSAVATSDANKILQLMKTTCGRMHGILSFRTTTASSWVSGYCAINVASGSLIYQTKGDISLAKTLIPDLRGCQVRTLYDPGLRSTYLDLSTHSSGLGIHLRPHVPETFDSWLAALLCWQPIRPKGVQNKMTKPQSAVISERRLAERRRNSEINLVKDAAIIKVGKMMYWDKVGSAATSTVPPTRRASTYKMQRSMCHWWRKVSCTLQENGQFKLYTESDVTLVSVIQLSQLSRCAIQQLDPSVLEDEFCIAIYPQYTSTSTQVSIVQPIYLSMESRVLFEVWFVLLRAFTIPELYGPEQPLDNSGLNFSQKTQGLYSTSTSDMFRVERLLSLRIIEAKLRNPRARRSTEARTASHHQSSAETVRIIGDHYAEVVLDGEVRARTAIKSDTSNPFWREDYNFVDLPPVLSSTSIVLKTRNLAQKDWTIVAHGPYAVRQGNSRPMTMVGDVEISSLDTMLGMVDLRLDDLERGKEIEKWWPILNEQDETVGEILMKVRAEELVVLMSKEYQPMSELLHSFSTGLTLQIAHIVSSELKRLSEILLNIFQVSGQASEWIMALAEDEIDGITKDTSVARLRYSRRIQSNDSYESGVERELFLRDLGKSAAVEANLLFRGNSLLTKALDLHMRRLGKEYLEETLSEKIRDIDESDPDCEVDPNRVQHQDILNRNWRNLMTLTSDVWKSIYISAYRCPPELRMIFRHIRSCADDRYGNFLRTVTYSSVSGFLFLRFFCPAVLNPKLFGLLKEHPRPRAQRTLTLIAKSLQGLANMTSFGSKEPWMEPMNAFISSSRQEFKSFVDSICSISPERSTSAIPPSYATPITILARLPTTSREGFPSLPYLIDHARNFAALVTLWLKVAKEIAANQPDAFEGDLAKFHDLCLGLEKRTTEALAKAEQAERPSGQLELKWEELVEQMEHSATLTSETPGSPTPSAAPAGSTGTGTGNSSRTSLGYFSRGHHAGAPSTSSNDLNDESRETETETETENENENEEEDSTTPPGSAPGLSPTSNSAFEKRNAENEAALSALHSPSIHSLDNTPERGVGPGPPLQSPASRDGGKLRFTDFVGGFRRKVRERDSGKGERDPGKEFVERLWQP
ncbi:MAG: hypothetical protein M1830_000024 [Pleopsidium flavum]|nr:MAG: hypothetical protein M1830_000024 [Pleopsidium flavum]